MMSRISAGESIEGNVLSAAGQAGGTQDFGSADTVAAAVRASAWQQHFWLLQQLASDTQGFVEVYAYRWLGPIELPAVHAALQDVAARQSILRTWITLNGNELLLNEDPRSQIELDYSDLRSQASVGSPEELVRERARDLCQSTSPQLLRFALWQTGDEEGVLVTVAHRLVFDRESADIFMREWRGAYDARRREQTLEFEPLGASFSEWAAEESRRLTTGAFAPGISFWQEHLGASASPLDLPSDHDRPTVKSYFGGVERVVVGGELRDRLERVAVAQGTNLETLLFAAFASLLYRHGGNSEIVLGWNVSLREKHRLDRTLGPLQNTLPIKMRVVPDQAFETWLAEVHETCKGALPHREVPFPALLEALNLVRDVSRAPVCDSLFSYHMSQCDQLAGYDVRWERIPAPIHPAMADVQLQVEDRRTDLELQLVYAADLFEPPSIRRMLGHLVTQLHGIAEAPQTTLQHLPLMTAEERSQMEAWNRTDRPFSRACVHQLIEQQAARTPDRIAVMFADQAITYRELNERANQLAHRLLALGLPCGATIGVCIHRSPEIVISLLAIWKAGAAYVPLDPAFPADRLQYMVEDARVSALVSQRSVLDSLPLTVPAVICVDDPSLAEDTQNPSCEVRPDDLAYVIYTSGSTGRPKGVQVPHRGVSNVVHSMYVEPGICEQDVVLAVTTISFDISVTEIFLPLTAGACIAFCSREIAVHPQQLMEEIERRQVTLASATPATWQMLIQAGWNGSARLAAISGGEALSRELADELLDRCGSVWNMYGPTETTVWASVARVQPNERIVIGKPLPNTRLYIADPAGQQVPVGVAGELLIGGCQLAHGYRNQPELTAEKFVVSTIGGSAERVYRTGDLARFREDGAVDYLGRIDHQVKIRGFRIELGEIETTIAEVDGVAKAVVVARDDLPGGRQLVAYIKPSRDGECAAENVRGHLHRKLPYYMLPSHFEFVDAYPLTPSGKIDRKRLPKPQCDEMAHRPSAVPPRDATETRLVEICERVLGIESIGVTDDFFALGGDSLQAVQVVLEIEKQFGRRIPLAHLFRSPSVETWAEELRHDAPSALHCIVPIRLGGNGTPLFLVHGIGGTVIGYHALASHLAGDRPIYGIQAVGVDGDRPPLTSVVEMASTYIREIKRVHPQGPVCLGGLSFGGIVALEIAQQLLAAGEPVEAVIMFDAYAFGVEKLAPRYERMKYQLNSYRRRFLMHVRNFVTSSFRDKMAYLAARYRTLKRKFVWYQRSRRYESFLREQQQVPEVFHNVAQAAWFAMHRYVPKPYRGDVLILRAKDEQFLRGNDPTLGWRWIVQGKLEVHEVPGDHLTFTTDTHAAALADEVKQFLRQLEQAE